MEHVGNEEIRLISEKEVARILCVSVKTVRRWRASNDGPSYLKIGRLVKYRLEALHSFLNAVPTGGAAAR